jgi:hypothetical protein
MNYETGAIITATAIVATGVFIALRRRKTQGVPGKRIPSHYILPPLPESVDDWTPQQRALVNESIRKFGLPTFPPGLYHLGAATPQRRFLAWEAKGICERVGQELYGDNAHISNEHKDEKP